MLARISYEQRSRRESPKEGHLLWTIYRGKHDPVRRYDEIKTVITPGGLPLGANQVRYHLPMSMSWREKAIARDQITAAILEADATIRKAPRVLFPAGRYVDIDVSGSDMSLSRVVLEGSQWLMHGKPLGPHLFVGAKLDPGEIVVRVNGVPDDYMEELKDELPALLRRCLVGEQSTFATVHDIWALYEYNGTKFLNSVDVLVRLREARVRAESAGNSKKREPIRAIHSATTWPGYVDWATAGVTLELQYPGRFPYCANCKAAFSNYKAGYPDSRHELVRCRRV